MKDDEERVRKALKKEAEDETKDVDAKNPAEALGEIKRRIEEEEEWP